MGYTAFMPELPEVETVRRGLEPVLAGRRIARVTARRRDLRRPLPDDFESRLAGRRVIAISRRAKYLLFRLDDGQAWIAHLGMSGRLAAAGAGYAPRAHDHVTLETEDGVTVVYNDARRFGLMTLCDGAALGAHPLLRGLGPDPLGNGFGGPALAAAAAGRRTPVKAVLLDQRAVAGLGNIYACESLYRAGVSPRRLGRNLGAARAERLAAAIRAVLAEAIAAGGSSLRDYIRADGEPGYFQHEFRVYGREGEACAAGHTVRRIVQGGRSTFFCPRCQR